ncbi:MAG: hypothetical protein V4514_04235 [Pseudomonadota bacterium]|uniref:hypothetical protein n=1 Tax=Phenylobacterium sp. TaxID=1871053 RepID=UPI0025F50E03|nr:hypothetical protein [Phenylobacterium sp.]MBT9471825.1 hypothetical protein [Phenylobacterium sp.]
MTQQRLFASSAGYCQNPACNTPLFKDTGSEVVHIAELAHVFAANADGPRAPGELTEAERGAFENLIVLCASCHTKIDKAEADYPVELLREWKASHQAAISKIFGATKLASRWEVRKVIEPLLAENWSLFESLNPNLPYSENPESEIAAKWQGAMRQRILPNNRRILAMLDENREYMTAGEVQVLEQFRQHVDDLGLRHLTDVAPADQCLFPAAMTTMMVDE